MSALASVVNVHAPQSFEESGEVPPFESYQAYINASDAFWHGDSRRAEELFLSAAHGDTEFTAAAVGQPPWPRTSRDCSLIDSIARALVPLHDISIESNNSRCRSQLSHCHGRNEEALRLTLERAELEPRTSALRLSAASAALWADRPERALELIRQIDPHSDLAWNSDSTQFAYWSDYTEALHLLGRHDEELAIAGAHVD